MNYVVVSTSVTDRVMLADGTSAGERLGGAGTYALCGARLWDDSAVLVTGVGDDYEALYGSWYRANALSTEGLLVRDAHTAVSQVQYQPDGERVETPPYGHEHYRKLEATPGDIGLFCKGAKGVYIFKELDQPYWDAVTALKAQYGFKLMWELNAGSARLELLDSVRRTAKGCDVFSINFSEARALLGAESVEDCAARLLEWEMPMIYLRRGARGALVLADGKSYPVPAAPDAVVVDVTGGGNSSSAAVLCGFCEGRTPQECGAMGSIAAANCIAQYGMPPRFDRTWAENLRTQMVRKIEQEEG